MIKEDLKDKVDNQNKNSDKKCIVVYNDNNTFQWVIQSLVEVCEHEPFQAEQCATLIHYKGKCDVKGGSYDELKPRYEELIRRQLSAKIE
jgi:ATP-dependent Clp protease adaptor protein ClpS